MVSFTLWTFIIVRIFGVESTVEINVWSFTGKKLFTDLLVGINSLNSVLS